MKATIDTSAPLTDIMTTEVITVAPGELMSKVRLLFEQNSIHHVPVVGLDGKVVGIISQHDLNHILHGFTLFKTNKSLGYNEAILNSLLVQDVMRKSIVTLNATDPISMAADIFRENLFHSIPILDEQGKLAGIVTTYDLIIYAYWTDN